jgi:hypothetical protein
LLCEDAAVRLFLLLAAGCFAPDPQPGAPCATEGDCPSGLLCAGTGTCERTDLDAGMQIRDAPSTLPVLIQHEGGQDVGIDTLVVRLDALPKAGHLLVMIGGDPASPLTTVTGGGVPAWTIATRSVVNANVEVWYGISDGSSAEVSITLAGSGGVKTAVVTEWANAIGLEGASSKAGTTSPATTTPIATTAPSSLAIFAAANYVPNMFGTPGPNAWTQIPFMTPMLSQTQWYRIVPTPTAVRPEIPLTGNMWDAAVVAFRNP